MSENPLSYSSGNQTSKPSNLKPGISAALASLEVQLDQELARYRRTRISHRTPIQKGLDSLIAGKPQPQSAITLANTQLQQQKLTGEQAAAYIRQQQASNSQAKTQTPPPPPIPETFPRVGTKKESNSQTQQISGDQQTISSSLNQSSIVKADINPNTQNENLSPSNDTTTKQPDDYLESSEALLRSLAEEPPQPQKPKTRNDSLLSPLSIGSMLLLLVSSITFGYIIFNFDNLPPLTIGSLFKRNSENNSSNNTDNVSSVEPDEIELTPIPKNPNLAADALPDINSIDDVAGATPKAQPTQAASPVPAVPATTVEPVAPTVTENTPSEPVEQQRATATPQNLDEIKPSNGGFYNVIVDNTDDTLAQVRKVIPDAYVSPEGKYVYLGAFKSKERVKQHLELLKENGITARVEEPN
ncbi:MAG: hypothetical protein IGS23_07875 [Rivularia sp. T60_A2020_040]|nr:hypothetical protein [Rivularia sp. T60_A2020_040]